MPDAFPHGLPWGTPCRILRLSTERPHPGSSRQKKPFRAVFTPLRPPLAGLPPAGQENAAGCPLCGTRWPLRRACDRRWRPSSPSWRTARPRVGDAGERKERTRARGLRQNVHHSTKCPPIFGKMSAFFRQNVRRSSAKCPPDSSQHMKFLDLSRPSKEIRIQDYSRKSALLPKGGTDGNEARTRPESCPRVLPKERLVARSPCPGAGESVLRSRRPGRLRGASSRGLPGTDRRGHKRQRIGGRTACNRAGASRRSFPTA